MKHQHELADHCCLLAKSLFSPRSVYRGKIDRPARTLYRTHTNATAAATGPIPTNSIAQEHESSASRSKRFENVPPFSSFLTDKHARQHTYLRISLTERCNLRCTYCMPEAGVPLSPQVTQLTTPEILLLSSLFVSQGINKIRLTGGEPTVRKDIVPLMQQLGDLRSKGLRELCITSNGIVLKNKLESMHKAGLTGVNLSLDTLDPGLFMIMTRRRGFERVIETMERILEMNRLGAGIDLKVNVVVMKGVNDSEILRFVELGKDKNLEVRFIEYMPFDENRWARSKMVTYQDMLHTIQQKYPELEKVVDRKGDTSKKYRVPGFAGRIGFITSMTENFCASCNRLRITSDGNLKVCLFGNTEVSLRDLIRKENHGQPIDEMTFAAMRNSSDGLSYMGNQEQDNELLQAIGQAVGRKKAQHAGMGVLEKTKNRPMILIDELRPMAKSNLFLQQHTPNHFGIPTASIFPLRTPSQLNALRLFSTTARPRNDEDQSQSKDESSDSSSVLLDQAEVQNDDVSIAAEELSSIDSESKQDLDPNLHSEVLDQAEVQNDDASIAAEELSSVDHESKQDLDPNLQDEILDIVFQLEKELEFLRSQVQILASQRNDDPKLTRMARDLIEYVKESTNGSKLRNEETPSTVQPRRVNTSKSIAKRSSHLDQGSAAHMVSVSDKPVTKRKATAVGKIFLSDEVLEAIEAHSLEKGDVFSIARIAAIQAVKKTSDIIPLCHPGLQVEGVKVEIILNRHPKTFPAKTEQDPLSHWRNQSNTISRGLHIAVTVESTGKTGVEMEAMTGLTAGLLTVYDMCKSIDKRATLKTKLLSKSGGKSGDWVNPILSLRDKTAFIKMRKIRSDAYAKASSHPVSDE